MIRATGKGKSGRQIVFLGLSQENIDRLRSDEPIHFPLEELGISDVDVVIFGGRGTEDDLAARLSEHVDLRRGDDQ